MPRLLWNNKFEASRFPGSLFARLEAEELWSDVVPSRYLEVQGGYEMVSNSTH